MKILYNFKSLFKKMKKYGDYFIKDGKFIGKFEEMYQSSLESNKML